MNEPAAAEPFYDDRPVRWRLGFYLALLAVPSVIATWFIAGWASDNDGTVQTTAAIVAMSIAILIQLVWWTFFARLSWTKWFAGIAILGVISAAVAATVRVEGFRGELFPLFAFRWSPTAEERAMRYFAENAPEAAGVAAADLKIAAAGEWPHFRGPNRDGVLPDADLKVNWEDTPPAELWKHPIGVGISGFAINGDLAITQEQRGEEELIVAYHSRTGEQIWTHSDRTRFSEAMGGDGPRATPTLHGERVYALGATGLLNCLDLRTGERIWVRNILEDAGEGGNAVANIAWGMAGSPLIWEGKLYVNPGGDKGRSVLCYNPENGEIIWAKGSGRASYTAPRIETIGGTPQLLIFDAEGLKGADPQNGELLWSVPWTNQPEVNAAQPIVRNDRIFISSGYTVGSALLEIRKNGDGWTADEVWRNDNEFKLKFNDAVERDGFVYGLDEGILACYEFATGKRQWKGGRYGYGEVILLGDTLIVLAEDGRVVAVEANPKQRTELGSFDAIRGKTWNQPAYANGRLYVRNSEQAACYRLKSETAQTPPAEPEREVAAGDPGPAN